MKQQILKQDIDMWKAALALDIVDYHELLEVKNGFLCSIYKDSMECCDCFHCPVYEYTGQKYCEDTPYENIMEEFEVLKNLQAIKEDIVDDELFLKDLQDSEKILHIQSCEFVEFLEGVLQFIK